MKIFKKIESETSICFRKTERKTWLRSTIENEQLCKITTGASDVKNSLKLYCLCIQGYQLFLKMRPSFC